MSPTTFLLELPPKYEYLGYRSENWEEGVSSGDSYEGTFHLFVTRVGKRKYVVFNQYISSDNPESANRLYANVTTSSPLKWPKERVEDVIGQVEAAGDSMPELLRDLGQYL